jgi:hypothetical protein
VVATTTNLPPSPPVLIMFKLKIYDILSLFLNIYYFIFLHQL